MLRSWKQGMVALAVLVVLVVTGASALAVGSGSLAPSSGWYPAGTNLTVTATPTAGDELKGWSGDTNSAIFGAATITFLVDAPKTITATFIDIMHTITASAGMGGSISPTVDVAEGDDATFTITPSNHYHIADVVVDSSSVGPTNSYTFFNVTNARSITASFDINQYTVTFDEGVYGSRTGGGNLSQTIDHGSAATEPIMTADAGYAFSVWDSMAFTNVTEVLSITALYTTNSYTLTFDSAGGSAVADITQLYTTAVSPPADPTKTGYTFAGWSPPIADTMPLDGGSHTAQWTAIDYSFIVNSEHGTPSPAGTNLYAYGTTVEFAMTDSPVIIPSNSMYAATGWVGTGSLISDTGTNGNFVITNDTTMTWQWTTNYWIELNTTGE